MPIISAQGVCHEFVAVATAVYVACVAIKSIECVILGQVISTQRIHAVPADRMSKYLFL